MANNNNNANNLAAGNVGLQDVAEGGVEEIPAYVVLEGLIVVIEASHPEVERATLIPGKWRGIELGTVFYGIEQVNDVNGIYVDRETVHQLKEHGLNSNDRTTWAGITQFIVLGSNNPLETMGRSTSRFLPASTLFAVSEGLVGAKTTGVTALKNLFREVLRMTDDEINNQLRFSFVMLMPGLVDFLYKDIRNITNFDEPAEGWKEFNVRIRTACATGGNMDPYIFHYREEAEFAIILSIHCNSKEYNSENYGETIKKRMQAYYSQHGYYFGGDVSRPFLTTFFPPENLKTYHDYIPRTLRKAIYKGLKRATDDKYPWRPYLFRSLMEWNSMSLIRETYRVIYLDPPRKFLLSPLYVQQIRSFMNWWNENHRNNNQAEEFPYSWYHSPEKLDEVSHAKLPNLYSLVLKVAQQSGQMTHYKAGNLNPSIVSPEDIELTADLFSHHQSLQVDEDYLNIIGRRRGNNPAANERDNVMSILQDLARGVANLNMRQQQLENNNNNNANNNN